MGIRNEWNHVWFLGWVLFFFLRFVIIFDPALAQDLAPTHILDVTAAVPREFPPYYGVDNSGRPQGFAIDVMERIAELSGLKVHYLVEDSWSDVEESLRSGCAQVIPNIGLSDERKAWLDYTSPVETFSLSIFVREQTDDIKDLNDLTGRKVAAVRFNIGADLLTKRLKTGVVVLDDARQALFELLAGHVDAVVYPEPVFLKMARDAKIGPRIKTAGKSLLEIKRAIGVTKGRPELLERMDHAVAGFVGTKEYQQIFVKWFGEPPPFWTTLRVILLASGLALIIFLLVAGWRYISLIGLNRKLAGSIADRKRAEEMLRAIVENTNDGILTADLETRRFVTANKAICRMLGTTQEEILSLGVNDIHPAEHLPHVVEQFERQMRGEIDLAADIPVKRTDGSVFLADISSSAVSLSGRACLLGVFRDVTERKRAEEMLRRTEENFRRSLEESPLGVRIVSTEGDTIYANGAILNIYGYDSIEDWKKIPARKRYTPESYAKFQTRREKRRQGDYDPSEYEISIVRKDGEVRHLWVIRKEILWDGERQFQVIYQDITERKQAEEERKALQERLQRAEKMEALGTMAGGVAHDLNNVLGIVVGYSELLLDDLDESSSARSEAVEILKGGQRAAAMVQDLLTLARRGVPSRKVLNLNSIVMECQQLPEYAQLHSSHPNIEIKMDLEPDLLNISGSSVHLQKSIFNLVSNAVEAMPNGGTLTIKTRNQYLDKPVSGYDEVKEGDCVVLSLSDTGEGIAASDLKRIFEPFYTKKVMGRSGTGLGLAVVWGTVKDHFGYINVESGEGKGTTFTLYFPVTRGEITPEQVSVSAAEYTGNGESILIVDDVKEQRDLAERMLTKLNYSVTTVSSGEAAVQYLKQQAVDLLVLDMIMDPGMDGLDTYAKILEIHPHQKAIIVSGFSETERVSKAEELGAGAYLKKPYVLEKLGLAVRKEFDRPA
jgi:PAS domain S-box-containing protein